jgi:MFS family permease
MRSEPVFYGWYIVAVGLLSYFAAAFALSSTLSVFLKPLTLELGVSRGIFSLLRTGEVLIAAAIAPVVGTLVDRHGGRGLITIGALVMGAGFLLLSQVQEFWQFVVIRWIPVTIGDAFMGYMVVNVTLARWFIRRRGRAIAIASLGTGIAKVGMPLFAATLFVWVGWRHTWSVFGILTLALVVGPTLLFMRRSPEDMGLYPDGAPGPSRKGANSRDGAGIPAAQRQALEADILWSRAEALRTKTFWLLVVAFGVASVGITGLNLHVFSYVTDIGYPTFVAATVMSVIAFTQVSSTLLWGIIAERVDIRKAAMVQFLIQALGLSLAIPTRHLVLVYVGFFVYGIGLGGSFVLREIIWANFFGRLSLGRVRGVGMLITHLFAAGGAPFFGFLFDLTDSYQISFVLFVTALLFSAILIMFVRPPQKSRSTFRKL